MRSTLVVAVGLVGVLVAAACSDPGGGHARGLAHIHGLGVNPADGNLYAGTHYGVYRITSERDPELVGDIVQDFMGFTVTGPDHFLGSGHPGEDDPDQPPNLGLIETTDAGRSWNALSMNGEADFHALEYRHNRVYGHDSHSRRLMVSADKQTWDRRAAVDAIDIAVSPRSPDEILATTPAALMRSRDLAATFSPVGAAPAMVFLSWPDEGPLVGVDPNGTVYTSDDAGGSWQTRPTLGQGPHALIAAGGGKVFVATDRAVHRSIDNGATFGVYRKFNTR